MEGSVRFFTGALMGVACPSLAGIATAGVCKWRDAQGNLPFSDTRRVSGIVNAEGASLNVSYLIPVARALAAVGAKND